jgi:hypothetical protein
VQPESQLRLRPIGSTAIKAETYMINGLYEFKVLALHCDDIFRG